MWDPYGYYAPKKVVSERADPNKIYMQDFPNDDNLWYFVETEKDLSE